MMAEFSYNKSFVYTHKNPYHERLEAFSHFVLRDSECEEKLGLWNGEVFKKKRPIILEIGSGYGHFMMDYCEKNPEVNYVGMDYRFKRSFQLAKKLNDHPTKNFRYLRAKGERIQFIFDKNEVDQIFYFFPDPWPKTKHHKNRLFQLPFLEAAYNILAPGGKIFVKTDHDGYAEWMSEVLKEQKLFRVDLRSVDLRGEYPDHFLSEYKTKFEKIFVEQGKKVKAFCLTSLKE
jgi:tRNA (guanine-N7-)-methyltransferase